MTATTTGLHAAAPSPGARLRAALLAEELRLRSVRSTGVTLAAAVLLMVAWSALGALSVTSQWATTSAAERARFDAIDASLQGRTLVQVLVGTVGVLLVTAEYGTGSIRSTLAATPQRGLLLTARAAVFGVVAFVISLVATLAAFLVGQALLARKEGGPHADLSSPGAVRAVVGVAVYLALVGLLGLALGVAVRSTAAGVAGLFVLLLVLNPLVGVLPESINKHVYPYLPASTGLRVAEVSAVTRYSLEPWPGIIVLAGYVCAALAGAWWLLRRRDA